MVHEMLQARPNKRSAATGPITAPAATASPLARIAAMLNAGPAVQRLASLQAGLAPAQRIATAARVGPLPAPLKAGIESWSGISMDPVRVHRDSAEPAQLNAHAFARGTDIHLAPGQDHHLPHEAWHVVQQAQGRVPQTGSVGGQAINDAPHLEREATEMGTLAARTPAQRAERTAPTRRGGGVTQRVRFSQSGKFVGDALPADNLPPDLVAKLIDQYPGGAMGGSGQMPLTDADRQWIDLHGGMRSPARASGHVELAAGDWERLGAKRAEAMDIGGMSQSFFDRQSKLISDLADHLRQRNHLGNAPNRIASFRFARTSGGHLQADFTEKKIEEKVGTAITPSFLTDVDGTESLRAEVKANVTQTLLSAGQFQWIARNWDQISATHDVYVDVDYYHDRKPDRSGMLHKDSIGETLFVNLTYNNPEDGASPEYIVDNQGHAPSEQDFPQPARDLIDTRRHENRNDDGAIKGVTLPARGRVSFIDPAVWHATPLYDHRVPNLQVPNDAEGTVRDLRQHINDQPLSTGQKRVALGLFDEDDDQKIRGETVNERFATRQTFNVGGTTNIGNHLAGRRERRRSADLNAHPEHLARLQEQAKQPRSFIRTWIILRKK